MQIDATSLLIVPLSQFKVGRYSQFFFNQSHFYELRNVSCYTPTHATFSWHCKTA